MKTLALVSLLFLLPGLAFADWTTDYTTALAQAKAQNKLLLLDFTGSDWCGYCKLLHSEVLSQPQFKDFADNTYVEVTLDYPHDTPQSDAVKQQNNDLAQKFQIDSFPTLIVLSPDGRELGRQTGYEPGSGPGAVIAKLKSFH